MHLSSDCPTNCVNCTNDGKDVTVCVTCASKYYVDAGACTACMENCNKCSKEKDVETCNECEAGFSVKDGTCQGITHDMKANLELIFITVQ